MTFARVLIAGGAGFIGTHVARHLLETRAAAAVTSLDVVDPDDTVVGVKYFRHDVRQAIPDELAAGCDAVFNFAAVHKTPGHPDHEYFETNVAGATNVTNFCDKHGIATLVFTSSISVYGPSEQPLHEASPIRPNHAYGRSKWLAEEIHRAWLARAPNRKLVILRPAVVFGRGENGNFTRLVKLMRRGLFVFPGRKDTRKASGYVKELAHTLAFALTRANPYYLYNFAYRDCPTAEEICRLLTETGELHSPLGVVPLPAVELAGRTFEVLNACGLRNGMSRERIKKLTNSTYVVPQRLMDDGYPYQFSLASAFADWFAADPSLGVRPRMKAAERAGAVFQEPAMTSVDPMTRRTNA